jgi:capsular exopolysaccharide synthesis family protein
MASGPAGQPNVVTYTKPRSPTAEAYRTLRTNLQFAAPELRRLLLSSAGPNEGKSTAVANLAVVMAQGGTKVIVVDCDLRRPSQHTLFQLRNGTGLTTLLLGPAGRPATEPDLPLQPTAVEGLWLLASGPLPPNPAELLASSRLEDVLARLDQRADVLLIDSPPVVPFADAAMLCRNTDGVVLVVGAGTVKRDLARKAKAQLEAVGAPMLGTIVVNVAFDAAPFAPYYDAEAAATST